MQLNEYFKSINYLIIGIQIQTPSKVFLHNTASSVQHPVISATVCCICLTWLNKYISGSAGLALRGIQTVFNSLVHPAVAFVCVCVRYPTCLCEGRFFWVSAVLHTHASSLTVSTVMWPLGFKDTPLLLLPTLFFTHTHSHTHPLPLRSPMGLVEGLISPSLALLLNLTLTIRLPKSFHPSQTHTLGN